MNSLIYNPYKVMIELILGNNKLTILGLDLVNSELSLNT